MNEEKTGWPHGSRDAARGRSALAALTPPAVLTLPGASMAKISTLPGGTATQVRRPGLHQGRSAFITGAGIESGLHMLAA